MKLLRAPLLHFLLLGAGIFMLNLWFGRSNDATPTISIAAGDVARLAQTWELQWRRPPTAGELRGLVDQQIHEEILYREALALGLDKDDTIVRRRLAQKLEFLAEDLAEDPAPNETELAAFYTAHQERYVQAPQLSFLHLYFSDDRSRGNPEVRANAALKHLRGDVSLDTTAIRALGDPFMLQSEFAERTPVELDRLFGADFGAQVAALPIGSWQGPIASGYGLHLINVTAHIKTRLPPLAEIHEAVQRDYIDTKRKGGNAAFYTQLKTRYRIDIAPGVLP